jgi:hypothetical protein
MSWLGGQALFCEKYSAPAKGAGQTMEGFWVEFSEDH